MPLIDYASRDIRLILDDIQLNLRSALPDVNDFLVSSEGRFLIDQWAGTAEMLGYTIDRQGAEAFIDTVETRPNAVGILRLIGFQPANPTPEQVLVTLTRTGALDSDVVIPLYTPMIASSEGKVVQFVSSEKATIPAGSNSVTVIGIQGQWSSVNYTSNGSPFQRVILPSLNIAEGMIRVFVNDAEWFVAEDNTMVGQVASDPTFIYRNLADFRVQVMFGNGGEGFIPPKGSSIRVDYFTTLHEQGRIRSNEIQSVEATTDLVEVSLAANNPSPSSGGVGYETLDVARYKYPTAFKPMRRAVTLADWEALARLVPGVIQAHAVDLNIDSSLPFFKVRLYVIGTNATVSDALNRQVHEYMRVRRTNATIFDVVSPVRVIIDVAGSIYVQRAYNQDAVLAEVHLAIEDFFQMNAEEDSEIALGTDVSFSRLVSRMQSVTGVASVILTSPNADIPVAANEYAHLNSVILTVAGSV